MPKMKRGKLLIRRDSGSIMSCSSCGKNSYVAVHQDIDYLDLRSYVEEHGVDVFTRELQRMLRKVYPKECTERFLCRDCFRSLSNNHDRYDPDTGQADFTFMYRYDWMRRDWLTTEDAVTQVIKDGYIR